MKKYLFVWMMIIWSSVRGQSLDTLFENANTNEEYLSSITIDADQKVKLNKVEKWISNHPDFFEDPNSVKITSERIFLYGVDYDIVKKIEFVKAENSQRRKSYFAEITRRNEETRLAQIRRQEEIKRQEEERLASIKYSIETGSFTGNHFYHYYDGKYVGNFVNGKRQGYGEMYYGGGNWYKGQFNNDVKHGNGEERLKVKGEMLGIRLQGNYVNGQRHGRFTAYMGSWLTGNNTWDLEYDNGALLSKVQTNSALSDFVSDLSNPSSSSSSSSDSSYKSSSSKSTSNNEDCETQTLQQYNSLNKSRTEYGNWKEDNSLALPDYKQYIKFSDGTSGYVYQGSSSKKYFLSLGGTSNMYYDSYESVVRALYIYKICEKAPKIGRR